MISRKPFSRGGAENAEFLKAGEDILLGDAFVSGYQPQNRVQRADTKKAMSGNRESLMTRIFRLQNHMTADLVHGLVSPALAQMLCQIVPGEISRQLHQRGEGILGEGKALVPDQMQSDTARSGIGSVKKVSTNRLINGGSHRGPVITLRHDWLREALGDIAAVCFLRHFEDQLLHI